MIYLFKPEFLRYPIKHLFYTSYSKLYSKINDFLAKQVYTLLKTDCKNPKTIFKLVGFSVLCKNSKIYK